MNASVSISQNATGSAMLSGLARALVQGGKITQTQAQELSARATQAKIQLIDSLLCFKFFIALT